MRTVKTLAQLPGRDKPEQVDSVAVLAQELKASTAKHEQLMLANSEVMKQVADKFSRVPVDVHISESEKPKRWKFKVEYDGSDRITSITAEAQ